MRKRMIPDFVSLGVLALQNIRPAARWIANYEKYSRSIFLLQDVEDFWGPARIRPVVELNCNFFVRPADLVDVVGKRNGVIGLIGEKTARRIVLEGTFALLGCISKVPDVAVAFED